MWWTSKHLSVWGNFWPNLESLKTQIFPECFDTIQLKSSLELFNGAAAYIAEKKYM